jgi:hypothetical protein
MKANRLNAVLGARLCRSLFSQAFTPETRFAGRSKGQVYCLALEGSPLDRCYEQYALAMPLPC